MKIIECILRVSENKEVSFDKVIIISKLIWWYCFNTGFNKDFVDWMYEIWISINWLADR